MSRVVRLKPGAWTAQPLTPEAAKEVVASGAARADAVEAMAQSVRRLCWIVGGAGAVLSLLSVGAAAWVLTSADPPRNHFALIDPNTGSVTPAVAAADAPRHFTKDTARQYLRLFVESCATYVYEIRKQNYDRCTMLLGPKAQQKYSETFARSNPDRPQARYGAAATLTPERLRFTELPSGGSRVHSWLVRYVQVERRNGQTASAVPMSATVHFEWRPDLRMTEDQRTWNTAGMRVIDFAFGPDVAP